MSGVMKLQGKDSFWPLSEEGSSQGKVTYKRAKHAEAKALSVMQSMGRSQISKNLSPLSHGMTWSAEDSCPDLDNNKKEKRSL